MSAKVLCFRAVRPSVGIRPGVRPVISEPNGQNFTKLIADVIQATDEPVRF